MSDINAQNTLNETAISSEAETQQETNGVNSNDTQPEGQENNGEMTAQTDGTETAPPAEEPFLQIKYLKENIGLSREEAKNYAEIGKRYSDVRDQLERIAILNGVSVEDFLNGIEKKHDESYRESLMERFGGDEEAVAGMMELYEIKKQKTLTDAETKRKQEAESKIQTENERLANEFSAMKEDFPELTNFTSLPEDVKKAAYDGMSLSHAYLLHQHRENQKIALAQKNAQEAAKKSAGSMADDKPTNTNENALLKGIWG